MRKGICTLVVFCLGVSVFSQSDISTLQPPGNDARVLSAYLPNYAVTRTAPSNLAVVDRVIYFALTPGADSRLAPIPQSHLNQLRNWKAQFGFELYLGIYDHSGTRGSNSKGFDLILRDLQARQRFLGSLGGHLASGLFDGVDIDWEWPGTTWESETFGNFLSTLGTELKAKNMGLSIAVSPWQKFPASTFRNLSAVNIMLYDNPEQHATLEDMKKGISTFLKGNDVPMRLLYSGIPYYARGVASQGRSWREAASFMEIIKRYGYEPQSESFDGFYLNTRNTIAKKLDYIINAGMGGMVIWHIGMDIGGVSSLTRFARNHFRNAGFDKVRRPSLDFLDKEATPYWIGQSGEQKDPFETPIPQEFSKLAVLNPISQRRRIRKAGPAPGSRTVKLFPTAGAATEAPTGAANPTVAGGSASGAAPVGAA